MQSSVVILAQLAGSPSIIGPAATASGSAYDHAMEQIAFLLDTPISPDLDDLHDLLTGLAKLNRTLELNDEQDPTEAEGDAGASQQGMTHKPKDGFLDLDNKLKRLLKDLELLVSRLQKIKHTLENGVEHDPSIIKDLTMQARRLSRNLHSLERKFKQHAPTQDKDLRQRIREQLASAHRVKRDVDEVLAPVHEAPRPTPFRTF